MAVFGNKHQKAPARPQETQPRAPTNAIAPWDEPGPHDVDSIAPWETDPQAQMGGSRPFDQSYFNDPPTQPVSSTRPTTSRTNTDSPDNWDDARRPSVASATTASSSGSKNSGKVHKSLMSFFGDDPNSSRKGSSANLPDQVQNGQAKGRSDSAQTARPLDDRPRTPIPSSDVTPWDYQSFEDVSNYGSAPIRKDLTEDDASSVSNIAPEKSHKRGLLHRHTKSKDDPPRSQPAPTTNFLRGSASREPGTPQARGTSPSSTPMSSSSNLNRGASPPPNSEKVANNKGEKKGFFGRMKHKVKEVPTQEPPKPSHEPPRPITSHEQQPPPQSKKPRHSSNKSDPPALPAFDNRDRETSITSVDSASTIRPEPFPKIDRTFTASSKTSMGSRFSRAKQQRGQSQRDLSGDKARQGSQSSAPTGMFTLDTDLTDMSDIISAQPVQTPGEGGPAGGIFTGVPPTPGYEMTTPGWEAPDSWASRQPADDAMSRLPELDERGLPAIEEEDGKTYFMRVFRTDNTFATLSTGINATVSDVLQMLAKKSVLHDSIDKYQLIIRKHQLSRQMESAERPIALQKKLLQQAGYTEKDHIEDVGREDNSYLCRFTFSHAKMTGYGSGLDNDPGFSKVQKFSHVDLSGRSLVTIPIILYNKGSEIISLNLSRNISLTVPKDFITQCTNLREIKWTSNESWRLPQSLSWASRLTVLDVSNNRLEQLDHADLHRLTSLVSLKVSNNMLTELPANYCHFRQLRSLNLSSNNFTKFPEQICSLKALVDLDISFNKLSTLPKIGQLHTLERLWATNNDLKGPFNESFRSLENLKELDFRFNGITNLDNLTKLPNLETLLVGHNAISTFKGHFIRLRTLILDHNPMTSFEIDEPMPTLNSLNIASAKLVEFKEDMFDYMPSLTKLNLDKNHLSHMSTQIGRLSRLEHFSMIKNPLNVIPPSIGNLTELKYLNIRECNVKNLPPEIWYCRRLETLNVASNVLESFPKMNVAPQPQAERDLTPTTPGLSSSPSFEELGKLEDFGARRPSQASSAWSVGSSPMNSIRKNSVTSAYQTRKTSMMSRSNTEVSFATMTRKDSNLSQSRLQNTFAGSLRYLSLADNRLEDEVFRELVLLPELRSLNLSYNEIDDFPQGVLKRWPQLTELYLSGNELTSLPSEDFEESSNLKLLHLNANRFQVLPAELCNVHKLSTLDVGSNSLKYNVSNWPYDWNWNRNTNLKYLNFSANKRLEIKPAASQNQNQFNSMNGGEVTDLTSFNSLKYLRVLGLMDVTLLINTIPEDFEDRRVRTSASWAGNLYYGMADALGKHEHLSMFDLMKPKFRSHDAEILVGMFDGQTMSSGGSKVAKYLHENFAPAFHGELNKLDTDADLTAVDALRRTFLSLNKDMANYATQGIDAREQRAAMIGGGPGQGPGGHRPSITAQQLNSDDLNSGVVASILYFNGTELSVANVGDVQAILIKSNTSHRELTTKHDPAEPRERERIRDAGGYVSRNGKLNDNLEVSRAFGYYSNMPSVVAAPSTISVQLEEGDELILMASKHFWDFVTVDLAIDVARENKTDVMLAAQKLRDLAISYGSREKIMVMVLGISDLRKRSGGRLRAQSISMARELGTYDDQIFPSSRKMRRKGETLVGDRRLARLEEPEAPIGDVAICFTDIKNSTALWEILPVPMRSAIMIHNELMRRQLRIIGGYEVKTEGDAFMVSFPTVTSALLWCFSCQSHLLELSWPSEILDTVHCQEKYDADGNVIYRGLSVRMGIHWGRPVCEQDPITRRMDYFGPMVNKAARVSAVADGGQISVSSDFISEIQRTLEMYAETGEGEDGEKDPDARRASIESQTTERDDPMGAQIRRELRQLSSQGFEVKDLGEKKLKGLENPEFIYLVYPHSLAGRLTIPPGGGDKVSEAGPSAVAAADREGSTAKAQPGSLETNSELARTGGLNPDSVWALWDSALRLEMLCSLLEDKEKAGGLKKPELSLLTRMRERGGEVSDAFMLNLMEHQVVRIEVSHTLCGRKGAVIECSLTGWENSRASPRYSSGI